MPNMPTSPLDHRVGPPQRKFSVYRRLDRWTNCRPWRRCAIDGKVVKFPVGHATASITLDTYGHLLPSEMETLADRLELVRDAAVARRTRTRGGPADNRLSETAGG